MRPSRHHADRPVLITEAPVNADDEFEHRRKRYLVMMSLRAVCIVGAASTFHLSGWIAAAFVAAALVLPWAAVIIANDGPPKQELRFRRFLPGRAQHPRELTPGPGALASGDSPTGDPPTPPAPTVIDI